MNTAEPNHPRDNASRAGLTPEQFTGSHQSREALRDSAVPPVSLESYALASRAEKHVAITNMADGRGTTLHTASLHRPIGLMATSRTATNAFGMTNFGAGLLIALPVLVASHSSRAAEPETNFRTELLVADFSVQERKPSGQSLLQQQVSKSVGLKGGSKAISSPTSLVESFPMRMSSGTRPRATSRAAIKTGALPDSLVRRRSTRITLPVLVDGSSVPSDISALASLPVPANQGVDARTASRAPISQSSKTLPGRPSIDLSSMRILHAQTPTWMSSAVMRDLSGVRSESTVDTAVIPAGKQKSAILLASGIPSGTIATPAASSQATQGMQKVITVAGLKLPPTSQPLPAWMRDKTIPADSKLAPTLPPQKGGRVAQSQSAIPLRQPERPVTNSDRLPNQLEVSTGTFVVLLTTSDLNTVAIADPNVADVAVVNSRAVLVNGKTAGVTSLVIVDGTRIRQYQVRVLPAQGTRPTDVAAAIGLPGVSVRPLRDALILEGEVDSAEEVRRAVEIAGIFSTKVINQLTVRGTPSSDAALVTQIQNAINVPGITARSIGDTILLEGTAESSGQRQRAENIASVLGKKVLNLIELPSFTIEQVRESIGALPAVASDAPAIAGVDAIGIRIRQVGDQIILEGVAPNQSAIDQALATAARTGMQVVNRLQIAPAVPTELALLNSIQSAINIPGVRVSGTAKRLVLQGTVTDTNAAVAAEQIARSYATEVDNMLLTPNPINVSVDVKLIEINKNDLKNLGVTWTNFLDGAANPVGFVLSEPTSGGTPGLITANAGQNAAAAEFRTRSPLQASIRAVLDNGNARLLANPNTTVLSGRTATFQVGGQVPIPGSTTVTNSGSTTAIVFKDFGILIDIVPNARLDGVVTMRVRTEVSQPDFTLGVTPPGGGSPIPGFQRRSAVTEVTVQPNGTIALAGLMQNNARSLVRKVPILGNIPILGALFTSKRFQNDETELAIFVTPRVLPNPLANGATAPAGVVAAGNTVNVGTVMGNPGIASFNTGSTFSAPQVGGGGGQ
jgi:pilus assembly protein CpaC